MALRPGGTYVHVEMARKDRVEDLIFLRERSEAGELKSVIDRCFPLEQIVEAHWHVEEGHKQGHVVITVAHDDETG
jgi:NADPH:quinone reductase-like Zn-dependent oxidoreductase